MKISKTLVVSWTAKRARKDADDRRRAVAKLIRRLGKGGYHRYVRVVGDSRPEVDEQKIHAAGRWDGLHGVVTNLRGIGAQDLFDRYRQLWQVEVSFRITKYDLRVRPVFHRTDWRIRAHLAIAFMAYACVRHLAWRVALQKQPLSPRVIREALNDRQCSVLHGPETGRRYVIPSRPSAEAKAIYAPLRLELSARPYELARDGTEMKSGRA
ncbi:MAG: transposase [Paracoccaceae bacterium]|nr:transposase [Paracoccaceae bacterium]